MLAIFDSIFLPVLISIVIPALNEAAIIEETLLALNDQAGPFEVIVVDGGSVDDTVCLAERHAQVVTSKRGRANQMNAGANVARGEILLFLHADTHLPRNALADIRNAIAQNHRAGAFRLQFDASSPLLRFYSFFTRFESKHLCFGDRGLFVDARLFEHIGAFAPIPVFEDLDIVRRLTKHTRFVFLPSYVTTAARRFKKHGMLRQQLLNIYLWTRYMLGAAPKDLASLYNYDVPTTESPRPNDYRLKRKDL